MKPGWLALCLCGLSAAAFAEPLPACHGMRVLARGEPVPGAVSGEMTLSHQAGRLMMGVRSAQAYFSPEFGVILEDAAGAACQLRWTGDQSRGLAISGAGRWRAVEAGLCDPIDGSCTPVRIEFPAVLQTRPRG